MSATASTLSTLTASPPRRRRSLNQSHTSPQVVDAARPDLSDGACLLPVYAGVDFYADEGSPDIEMALMVCDRCPVIDLCLGYALATRDFQGVWGGMTGRERAKLTRRLRRRVV